MALLAPGREVPPLLRRSDPTLHDFSVKFPPTELALKSRSRRRFDFLSPPFSRLTSIAIFYPLTYAFPFRFLVLTVRSVFRLCNPPRDLPIVCCLPFTCSLCAWISRLLFFLPFHQFDHPGDPSGFN